MLFNSFDFIIFLLVVVPAFYVLPARYRCLWLLLTSCYFYMAFIPVYILFLFLLIGIDFVAGLWIERTSGPWRRTALIVSLTANLLLLGTFKYFNFFGDLMRTAAHVMGFAVHVPHLSLVLPLGLSFHTFQSMAYTLEVYRGTVPAERRLRYYALYVLFFPQLVAGPIERPQHLLPQLHEEKPFDPSLAVEGLRLMLWGFFKKIIVADRLADFVDAVYRSPAQAPRAMVILATYFFAFQIYLDFSGYTDIARGTARLFGVRLMENFHQPYNAQSIADFWRRWHISLSTWFRDYLYIPLGGSLRSRSRTAFNLLIVFLLSGLWHGANVTFVVWGLYHGLLMVLYKWSARGRERVAIWCRSRGFEVVWQAAGWWMTFHAVCLGWVFFRARTLSDAFALLNPQRAGRVAMAAGDLPMNALAWVNRAGLIFVVLLYENWPRSSDLESPVALWPPKVRWACYYSFIILLGIYGKWGDRQFIYFQF